MNSSVSKVLPVNLRGLARFGLILASAVLISCGGSSSGSGGGSSSGGTPNPERKIVVTRVFPNLVFAMPVALLQAPGNSSRWFVVEQDGIVRVFTNNDATTTAGVFIDISDRVVSGGELGLLGMAFHPGFATNRQVFLSYIGSGPMSRISRFTSSDGGLTLHPTSEEILLSIPQTTHIHKGGNLAFGPDGFLYAGFGDDGGNYNSQDTTNLLGTFVRIAVDGGTPYAIPPSNPYAGNPLCTQGFGGADCPEIWAYGFRNPWRFSFDRSSGRLWAGDVGENAWEEVDIVEAGRNYGWPEREGAHCNPNIAAPSCSGPGFTDPVIEYGGGHSITGGYVYRGSDVPDLFGSYVFGDFITGNLYANGADAGPATEAAVTILANTGISISSFGEDQDGELYVLNYAAGTLHQIALD